MIPDGNDADTMDFVFLTASTNFAFTDFEKHIIFTTELDGAELSDSDAMMACLKRAYDRGTPILEGSYLQTVTRAELEKVFRGNIEMPMLMSAPRSSGRSAALSKKTVLLSFRGI